MRGSWKMCLRHIGQRRCAVAIRLAAENVPLDNRCSMSGPPICSAFGIENERDSATDSELRRNPSGLLSYRRARAWEKRCRCLHFNVRSTNTDDFDLI